MQLNYPPCDPTLAKLTTEIPTWASSNPVICVLTRTGKGKASVGTFLLDMSPAWGEAEIPHRRQPWKFVTDHAWRLCHWHLYFSLEGARCSHPEKSVGLISSSPHKSCFSNDLRALWLQEHSSCPLQSQALYGQLKTADTSLSAGLNMVCKCIHWEFSTCNMVWESCVQQFCMPSLTC